MVFIPRSRNPRLRRHPGSTGGAPPGAGVGTTRDGKTITRVGIGGAITAMTTQSFVGKSAQGGGRPYPNAGTSTVSVSAAVVAKNSAITITFQAKDVAGTNITVGGATVTFGTSGGASAGTIGAVTDVGNGTYTASFTGTTSGFTATTITANVDGVDVTTTLPTVRVYETPTVTAISPSTGYLGGGTSVTITGTKFDPATTFTIGGAAVTSLSVTNATTATGVTPAGTAGAQDIVATTAALTGTLTNGFTYYDALFVSDWTTLTDTDGGRWTTAADTNNVLTAMADPTGSAPTTNVLRVKLAAGDVKSGNVSKTGLWTSPGVGESRYFRIYLYNAILDAEGNFESGLNSSHPTYNVDGAEQDFSVSFSSKADTTFPLKVPCVRATFPKNRWIPCNSAKAQQYLNKNEWYRFEWKLTKEAADTYALDFRIYDSTDALKFNADGVGTNPDGAAIRDASRNLTLAASGTGLAMLDANVGEWHVGNNGGPWDSAPGPLDNDNYWYWAGAMVRSDDWCGPY